MFDRLTRLAGAALLSSLFVLMASGCAESDSASCRVREDCAQGQICTDGACTIASQATCYIDQDCPGGYICSANVCARTVDNGGTTGGGTTGGGTTGGGTTGGGTTGGGTTGGGTTGGGTTGGGTTGGGTTTTPTTDNPRVSAISPTDNATGVGRAAEIRVTFSKPMDLRTINALSVQLKDPDNQRVDAPPTYDANTRTAVLRPAQPMLPASRYRVVVDTSAQDADGNSLYQKYEFSFVTEYTSPASYPALAEAYAPVVYQAIEDTSAAGVRRDIPTRVDFDGDTHAANNKANSTNTTFPIRAHVYYHVTESDTHYFLHYMLYYPVRYFDIDSARREHSYTGMVVVVAKQTMQVVLAEGLRVDDSNADYSIAFKPSSSAVSARGGADLRNLQSFDASTLEDGNRYPLYVNSGVHVACNFHVRNLQECPHEPGQFKSGVAKGVVLRAGPNAQQYSESAVNAQTNVREMTYKLLPFVDTFWVNRSDYACGLFDITTEYRPDDSRPRGPDPNRPMYLPARLCSQDSSSFGKMPFRWLQTPGSQNGGQWFIDPAHMLNARFNFGGDAASFATSYCYNLFLGIDRRTEPACRE